MDLHALIFLILGDYDLVVGEKGGDRFFFENTGSASAPVYTERTDADSPFDGIDVGDNSIPSLADVDGDGKSRDGMDIKALCSFFSP